MGTARTPIRTVSWPPSMPITRCNSAGFQILLGLALLVVTLLMLDPQPPQVLEYRFVDKLAHAATFCGLAFLADAGWPERTFDRTKFFWLISYGVLTEVLQHFVPNRMFSGADVAADAVGIMLYALAVLPLLRYLRVR